MYATDKIDVLYVSDEDELINPYQHYLVLGIGGNKDYWENVLPLRHWERKRLGKKRQLETGLIGNYKRLDGRLERKKQVMAMDGLETKIELLTFRIDLG